MGDRFFYVSNEGNDNWSGTLADPDRTGKDGPFLTLERARDAVKELKVQNGVFAGGISINIRGGDYYLSETFTLGPEDSGTKVCPVKYMAYQDEKPILYGSKKIYGWKHFRDGIYMAQVPGIKGGRNKFRQLFLNGQRMIRSRWPDFEKENPLYGGWAMTEDGYNADESFDYKYRPIEIKHTTSFKYTQGSFSGKWQKPWLGEVSYYAGAGGWKSIVPIKSIDVESRIIELEHGGYQFDMAPWYYNYCFRKDNRFFVENLLEELNKPGEWCVDYEDGIIYFMPPSGTDLDISTVTIPSLSTFFDIRGVNWLEICGLTFTQSLGGDNLHRQGVEGGGCMSITAGERYVGEAIFLKDTQWCRIEKNHFDKLGGNAVYIMFNNRDNIVKGNEISYCGASGICFAGSSVQFPRHNEVCDNHIHHCGIINKGVAGILMSMSGGNILHHNLIEYMPHHAINLSESPNGRNIVEYNEIHHVCQENEDNGAINCWMELPGKNMQRCGHIIRCNFITDVYGCEVNDGKVGSSRKLPAFGIYLDNYTSNCTIYGNIIARCGHAGIRIHGGKNNLIENNIVVDCRYAVEFGDWVCGFEYWKYMGGFMSDNYVLRNIFYQDSFGEYVYSLHAWTEDVVAKAEFNLIYNQQGYYYINHMGNYDPTLLANTSEISEVERIDRYEKWQALGYDISSCIADPQFADVKKDDYSLASDSPALSMGFVPLDIKKIGIRGV